MEGGKHSCPEESNSSICAWTERRPVWHSESQGERWEGRVIGSWILAGQEKQRGFFSKCSGTTLEGFRQGW